MKSTTSRCVLLVLVAMVTLSCVMGKSLVQPGEKERLINDLDLVDEDGSVETALINYLFAKQIVNRMRAQGDVTELQRKRSYWKQCAFNAVSCFG